MKYLFSLGVVLLISLLSSTKVYAVCTASIQNASFGSASSFQVASSILPTSTYLKLTCDVVLVNLLSTDWLSITLTSATNMSGNQASLKNTSIVSSDQIPINICTTANCAASITSGKTVVFPSSDLLSLVSGKTFTIPIYFQTTTGQNVAAGLYSVALNLGIRWNICQSIGVGSICINSQSGNSILSPSLNLTISNDCSTINAPNVNFGNAPLISSLNSISQTVYITCTKNSSYTVGISNGINAIGNTRNMANNGRLISYDIYKSSTTNRWGSMGSDRWASLDSSSVSIDQLTRSYNYVAKILSGQNTPQAGNYQDTLVIDIVF